MLRDLAISFFLALRSLQRGNKSTSVMTILIMTLAFINLVFVSAIFLGITESLNRSAIETRYGNIVIEPSVNDTYLQSVNSRLAAINSIPGVIGTAPHYIQSVKIFFDEDNDGEDIKKGSWVIKSIDVPREIAVTNIQNTLLDGEYLGVNDFDRILIGVDISGGFGSELQFQNLDGVKVGEEINVLFSNGIKRTYVIKGIFRTKNTQTDQTAFITKKEMESVLGVSNRASEVLVKIKNTGEENQYIKEFRRMGYKDEVITSWKELMGFTSSVSKSFGMISMLLGVIGIVVAGITIFIVIYVNVVNKRRQIGILKAIGMKEGIIIRSYVMQTLFYSTMGVLLGLLSIYFILEPAFLKHPLDFPVGWVSLEVESRNVFFNSISLLGASIVGGFIPAFRAAKESILKAIWG